MIIYNKIKLCIGCFMVFNATFNIISDISWWSVLLVEETPEKTTASLLCIGLNTTSILICLP